MTLLRVELAAPACLTLGLLQLDGQPGQLGIALQHPPIQLMARSAALLAVSGARADLAHKQAEQFLKHHGLSAGGELEIELAIPNCMGLGSDALLALSTARALAVLHGLSAEDTPALAQALGQVAALEQHAFAQGGLLVVGLHGGLLRRAAIAHANEPDDWVFVLVLPRVPAGTPASFEVDQRRALATAALHGDPEAGRLCVEALWPALERDDIAAFAQALMAIQALSHAALAAVGQPLELTLDEQATLAVMRDGGALAYGRALGGLGLYGLIKGGGPSRALRQALSQQIGLYGGTVMATICDTGGARHRG